MSITDEYDVEGEASATEPTPRRQMKPRDVTYLGGEETAPPEAFIVNRGGGLGRPSPYEAIMDQIRDNEALHGSWRWIGLYGNGETATQTTSRLRKQYVGVEFRRGKHPSGKFGIAAFYDQAKVDAALKGGDDDSFGEDDLSEDEF